MKERNVRDFSEKAVVVHRCSCGKSGHDAWNSSESFGRRMSLSHFRLLVMEEEADTMKQPTNGKVVEWIRQVC